jgi:hypothetical protein
MHETYSSHYLHTADWVHSSASSDLEAISEKLAEVRCRETWEVFA